jgi:hypothetical protein
VDLAKTQAALAGMPELAFAVVKRTTGAETTQQLDAKFAACMTQLLPALAIK